MNQNAERNQKPMPHYRDGLVVWEGSDDPYHQELRANLYGELPNRVMVESIEHIRQPMASPAFPAFAVTSGLLLMLIGALAHFA